MKNRLSLMSASLMLIAVAGCAAAPSTPTASNTGMAATATAPAVAAAAAAPIGPAVAPEAVALAQSAHELGYTKKVGDNKAVYYCKSDATLGTRLSSTKCLTEDQMSAVVQRSIANRQNVAEMERKGMTQPGGS